LGKHIPQLQLPVYMVQLKQQLLRIQINIPGKHKNKRLKG
jgi:hypothetical protein